MTPIKTSIWLEEPEHDDDFATRAAYCHGYDVYGDLLGQARWADMIFLLFRGEAPTLRQAALLDALCIALANAGPRDAANHAAMCAGVGGSTAAATLMAALAVGAGQVTGAREVWSAMRAWRECGVDLLAWQRYWSQPDGQTASIWPACAHRAGFEAHAQNTRQPVLQTLACLAGLSDGACLPWLNANRQDVERLADAPLALAGVAAAALVDLGFDEDQGEMMFLMLRLPGAAAHALEQRRLGHKNFPFFEIELMNDPQKNATSPMEAV